MAKVKKINHDLSEIASLAPEQRDRLKKEKGIHFVEMLVSLSVDPVVRKDLTRLLEIDDDVLDVILEDAKALFSKEEIDKLCSKKELHGMF